MDKAINSIEPAEIEDWWHSISCKGSTINIILDIMSNIYRFAMKKNWVNSNPVKLIRGGEEIYNGKIRSLKRFKDDVKEVAQGYECGIAIEGYKDLQEKDIIEAYEVEEVAPELA